MTTRKELVDALRVRYGRAAFGERIKILDEVVALTDYHGKSGRSSTHKIPFVAAVQATESGQPIFMCLSQRLFTKESIRAFVELWLAASATLVSHGLGCFTVVRRMGILHETRFTGGRAASAKPPSFMAVNPALGNIMASACGTFRAVSYRKFARRSLSYCFGSI